MSANLDFDFDKWYKTCETFRKNKEGMNMAAEVEVRDGQLIVRILSIDKKYEGFRNKMKSLILEVCQGAVMVMSSIFCGSYAFPEDLEAERKINSDYNFESLNKNINTLIAYGADRFLESIHAQEQMLGSTYLMKHLSFDGKDWKLSSGDVWNGYAFQKPDGTIYTDYFCEVMKGITAMPVTATA